MRRGTRSQGQKGLDQLSESPHPSIGKGERERIPNDNLLLSSEAVVDREGREVTYLLEEPSKNLERYHR